MIFLLFLVAIGWVVWYAATHQTPYSGYQISSNGHSAWVSLWTCKECGELTKVYGRGSGFRCRDRKCKGDRVESVAHWKAREKAGIPYTGKTEFVPRPRESAQVREMNYHDARKMLEYKAQGLTYKQALQAWHKEEPFTVIGYDSVDAMPDLPWPNYKV